MFFLFFFFQVDFSNLSNGFILYCEGKKLLRLIQYQFQFEEIKSEKNIHQNIMNVDFASIKMEGFFLFNSDPIN